MNIKTFADAIEFVKHVVNQWEEGMLTDRECMDKIIWGIGPFALRKEDTHEVL